MSVLIVDEDADLRALLAFSLENAGYGSRAVAGGDDALALLGREAIELVVLDIDMPDGRGIDLCREIRSRWRVPIIALSTHNDEDQLVAVLEAGADDRVRKPFSPRALLARMRALLRRAAAQYLQPLRTASLQLDCDRSLLNVAGMGDIRLTPLECQTLRLLIGSAGRAVSAENLLLHLWGRTTPAHRRTLKQLIYRLRRKVEANPAAPRLIETVPNVGYRLAAE